MWFSPAHNVVVYPHPQPEQVCAAIKGARPVNGSMVAVPADLHSLQLVRLFHLPVPNFMDIAGYDWPIRPGRTPKGHQKVTANFMALHPRAFCLNDMGTMKTSSILWAADFLMRMGAIKRAIIIAPLSTLERVWADELYNDFLGRRKYEVLYGDRDKRIERLKKKADFYIINHDGFGLGSKRPTPRSGYVLGPIAEALRDRDDINLVIVDEGTAFKDGTTLRSQILKRIVGAPGVGKPYVWWLTGTPTPNEPTDAHAQAVIVRGVTESFRSFKSRTMHQISQFKWLPNHNAADEVNKILQPSIRYSLEDCVELPPCTIERRDVDLSPTQVAAYREMKQKLQLQLRDGTTITAVHEAALRTKLIQIACGAVYGPNREVHKTDAGPRIAELHDIMEQAKGRGGKFLIFACLTSVVNLLYGELKKKHGDKYIAKVYGDTSARERNATFMAFQDPNSELRAIVADPGTMAHGLTLTEAATTIWFSPTDKAEHYEQANRRFNRPGQTRKMLVVQLAATPVEREIYRRLDERRSLQGVILKMAEMGL